LQPLARLGAGCGGIRTGRAGGASLPLRPQNGLLPEISGSRFTTHFGDRARPRAKSSFLAGPGNRALGSARHRGIVTFSVRCSFIDRRHGAHLRAQLHLADLIFLC